MNTPGVPPVGIVDQDRARSWFLDQVQRDSVYRDMLERAVWRRVKQSMPDLARYADPRSGVGRASQIVPVPRPLPVTADPDPVTLQTVREAALRVTVDQRRGLLLDDQTFADMQRATLDKIARWMGDEVDRLMVQGRAYQTLVQGCTSYRDPGAGFAINAMDPGNVDLDSLLYEMRLTRESGCRDRGCRVRISYSIMQMATVIVHNDAQYLVDDHVLAHSRAVDEVQQQFLRWTYQLHGGRVADVPEQHRGVCHLCSQERDPDVEPVEIEVPGGPATWGPMPLRKAEREGFYVIEACSAACATAYAIATDPVRERPALGVALEQRHQERVRSDARQAVRKNGGRVSDDVTGSKDAHDAWNPWKEPAD